MIDMSFARLQASYYRCRLLNRRLLSRPMNYMNFLCFLSRGLENSCHILTVDTVFPTRSSHKILT
ncbi:hypothetical protein Plhal304r1_c039g0116221 [Plasmopara halstedii]